MSTPADALSGVDGCRCRGVSLVEMLAALAIGSFVIAGAAAVYARALDVRSALDANARLQETARHALAVIEADVRMAGYWGLTNRAEAVTANASLGFPDKCGGRSWITETTRYIDGTNNAYLPVSGCAALSGGPRPGSDVLVLRRASAQRITPQSPVVAAPNQDRVLIVTSRVAGEIFVPRDIANAIPAGYAAADVPGDAPLAETRALIVNAYYVSAGSSVARGFPALRRKTLTAGPDIGDEEVVAGVEDLQFRIGVDTTGDSSADLFVDPGAVPAGALPVSVRVWLRLRAQERDNAYTDDRTVVYADRTAEASGDHFRRLLVAKTLQIRNARR